MYGEMGQNFNKKGKENIFMSSNCNISFLSPYINRH